MSVPAFIDLDEPEQVAELRSYLKAKGAEISEEPSEEGPLRDLAQLIEAANMVWKDAASEQEVDGIYNSIISLMLVIPSDKVEPIIQSFCEKVAKVQPGEKYSASRVKILSNLFNALDERSPHRYIVYHSLVKLAGQLEMIQMINTDLDEIKRWVAQWDISAQKVQVLLRSLHEAFLECKLSEKATKVMIELLGTYTEENASQAREDAQKCIVTCLADSKTFLMDHLLMLKPVKYLEGQLIHDLLTIFVSGKLAQYLDFYNVRKEFVDSIGLSHEQNLQKMRLLTFMQMAEGKQEVDFDVLEQEMKLETEEVEAFIIDVVRTRTVHAKIDQMARKVIISSTTNRTFGKQQWQLLRERLMHWQQNLDHVLGSLQSLSQV